MKCLFCKRDIVQLELGRKRRYCSNECRWSARADKDKKVKSTRLKIRSKVCLGCKKSFTLTWKESKRYCSIDCRPKQIKIYKTIAQCQQCDNHIKNTGRLYCDGCILKRRNARRIHTVENSEKDRKSARLNRERLAPGLGPHQRMKLLRQWRSQMKPCFYCNGKVETVDHIIPLSRGGTNFEGNLTPACRQCNSKKSTKFITEWKLNASAKAK